MNDVTRLTRIKLAKINVITMTGNKKRKKNGRKIIVIILEV